MFHWPPVSECFCSLHVDWWFVFTQFFGDVLHSLTNRLQVLSADLLISHSLFILTWEGNGIYKGGQRIDSCLFVKVGVPDRLIIKYPHGLAISIWTAADPVVPMQSFMVLGGEKQRVESVSVRFIWASHLSELKPFHAGQFIKLQTEAQLFHLN